MPQMPPPLDTRLAPSCLKRRNSKFAKIQLYQVLESRIYSSYFGKRVLSLGQLLTEIASLMDEDKLRNY